MSVRRARRSIERIRQSGVTPETQAALRVIEQAILDAPSLVRSANRIPVSRIITPQQMEEILFSLLGDVLSSQLVVALRDERDRRNRV